MERAIILMHTCRHNDTVCLTYSFRRWRRSDDDWRQEDANLQSSSDPNTSLEAIQTGSIIDRFIKFSRSAVLLTMLAILPLQRQCRRYKNA